MPTKHEKLTLGMSIVAICTLLLVAPSAAVAQDPLVGTWNMTGTAGGGLPPFIAVMTFNLGGTTVEFDTAGTNSSAGESIVLGKWRKTASLAYTVKEENYVYDSSGNLAFVDITAAKIALASTGSTFSGNAVTTFYTCTVSLCPGTLVTSAAFQVTGKRF